MTARAILYAAGRGNRLGSGFERTNKVLLSFGGRSLLEWHGRALAGLGIEEMVVVTGHKADLVAAEAARVGAMHSLASRTIYNPDYRDGSVLSFAVSIGELEGAREPVLLMDGDVLYAPEILERLVRSPHDTALLIDRHYQTIDDDPVLVPIADGRPFDFRKCWHGQADAVGESIGFFKVSAADMVHVIERTRERAARPSPHESYDEVLRDLVVDGRFGFEDVTGLPWTEIDFPHDVERARAEILPAILERLDAADPI